MVQLLSANGTVPNGVYKFAVDTMEDLDNITKGAKMGSEAVVTSTSETYIKNGDGTNYNEFKRNREQYNKARNIQRKRQNDLDNKMKEPDAWAVSDMEDAHNKVADAKANTEMAASDTIGSRPGIIGKGQRAANVGAYRAGKALKGVKDSATKFMHDKIGLE